MGMNRRELIQLMGAALALPSGLILAGLNDPPEPASHGILVVKGLYAFGTSKDSGHRVSVSIFRPQYRDLILKITFHSAGDHVKWIARPQEWLVFPANEKPLLELDSIDAVAGLWGQYDDGTLWGMSVGCDEDRMVTSPALVSPPPSLGRL